MDSGDPRMKLQLYVSVQLIRALLVGHSSIAVLIFDVASWVESLLDPSSEISING